MIGDLTLCIRLCDRSYFKWSLELFNSQRCQSWDRGLGWVFRLMPLKIPFECQTLFPMEKLQPNMEPRGLGGWFDRSTTIWRQSNTNYWSHGPPIRSSVPEIFEILERRFRDAYDVKFNALMTIRKRTSWLLSSYEPESISAMEKVKENSVWNFVQMESITIGMERLHGEYAQREVPQPGFGWLRIALPVFSKEEKKEFEKWYKSTLRRWKRWWVLPEMNDFFCSGKRLWRPFRRTLKVFFNGIREATTNLGDCHFWSSCSSLLPSLPIWVLPKKEPILWDPKRWSWCSENLDVGWRMTDVRWRILDVWFAKLKLKN